MSGNRGIRNNNPMNIRISTNKWHGKVIPSTDPAFEQFKTAEDGIRAGAKLLLTYSTHYGKNTPYSIIDRFAPAIDNNDTVKYATFIANKLGVKMHDVIDVDDYKTMVILVTSIIDFENNGDGCPYSEEVIRSALQRAGVHETPNKPIMKEPVVQVATVSAVGLTVQLAATLTPLQPLLEGLMATVPWAVGAVVVFIAGFIIYNHLAKRN